MPDVVRGTGSAIERVLALAAGGGGGGDSPRAARIEHPLAFVRSVGLYQGYYEPRSQPGMKNFPNLDDWIAERARSPLASVTTVRVAEGAYSRLRETGSPTQSERPAAPSPSSRSAANTEAAQAANLSWLQVFDPEDLEEFAEELKAAVDRAVREGSWESVEETVERWRITARALEDPIRRSILLGSVSDDDFVEVERPGSTQ